MRTVFIILGCLALGGWFLWYQYIVGMACAFGSVSGDCTMPMPWDLNAEDRTIMVWIPGAVTATLFAIAYFAKPRRNDE